MAKKHEDAAPETLPTEPPAPGSKRFRVSTSKGGYVYECYSLYGGSDCVAQAVLGLGISDPSRFVFTVEEIG